jgi:hypothetical protein
MRKSTFRLTFETPADIDACRQGILPDLVLMSKSCKS